MAKSDVEHLYITLDDPTIEMELGGEEVEDSDFEELKATVRRVVEDEIFDTPGEVYKHEIGDLLFLTLSYDSLGYTEYTCKVRVALLTIAEHLVQEYPDTEIHLE